MMFALCTYYSTQMKLPTGLPKPPFLFRATVSAPLFLTRQVLYSSILGSSVFFVLLPISIITYLSFYRVLIPTERMRVPSKFGAPDSAGLLDLKLSIIDARPILPFLERHQDLEFLVRLSLHGVCLVEKSFQQLPYEFNLTLQLSFNDKILVNCDSRYIYVEKNSWVPYNLRYWVPPIFVNIFKYVDVDFPLIYIQGKELYDIVKNERQTFRFDHALTVLIDSRKTFADFVIEWEGIRFYLVNYYFTSLIIGTVAFWLLSTWFFALSALFFLMYFSLDEADTDAPRRAKRDIGTVKFEDDAPIKQE